MLSAGALWAFSIPRHRDDPTLCHLIRELLYSPASPRANGSAVRSSVAAIASSSVAFP